MVDFVIDHYDTGGTPEEPDRDYVMEFRDRNDTLTHRYFLYGCPTDPSNEYTVERGRVVIRSVNQ